MKNIVKRSNYPQEILTQIAAKKEREIKIKEEEGKVAQKSIAAQIHKEQQEEMYEKVKRQKEKEFMNKILKR